MLKIMRKFPTDEVLISWGKYQTWFCNKTLSIFIQVNLLASSSCRRS